MPDHTGALDEHWADRATCAEVYPATSHVMSDGALGAPLTVALSGRHGRQIETNWHVLDQFFLGNLLLHL